MYETLRTIPGSSGLPIMVCAHVTDSWQTADRQVAAHLHVRNAREELPALHALRSIEDGSHSEGNHPRLLRAAHHGVRFAAAGLPVRKDRPVETARPSRRRLVKHLAPPADI